ncbi:Inorganic triphosphatase [Xylophilus ampelinus]|nr:CYTH and CHAD domain-containing protein [Variovorax sp.]VTY28910.1 Inorganic triphosphatase [Xylophilus ampelinus]
MEIEFKFCIPPERLQAVEAAMRRGAVQRTRLRARYVDTPGGALAAAGMVLRLRKEGSRWVQTVKATGDGPLQRWEHNVDLGTEAQGDAPTADPQLHAGTPVGDRLLAVLRHADGPLRESYATDIERLTREVRSGGATVELALDAGRIRAYGADGALREAPVCELELELLRGDVRGLVALAQAWSQRHGLWFSTVSKAERGERLLHGIDAVPAVKAAPIPASFAGLDGRTLQQAAIAHALAQILPNASEVAAGSRDDEQVHQLRIGLRRLRTALREFDALAPGLDPAWEAPLVEAFRALGEQRDRALVLAQAQAALAAAGAPPIDMGDGGEAADDPAAALRAPAFQAVLVALIGHGAMPPDPAAAPGLEAAEARRQLRDRLRRLHRQVLRDGQRFDRLDAEGQHRVRKRLKRLRYLAEFAAPLFRPRAAARYLARLRPAQDTLGHFNDEAVALALYRARVTQDPRAWFAVGWLQARHEAAGVEAQRALHRLRKKAVPFWTGKTAGP